MAKGPTCLMCGTAHFSTQRCPAAEEAAPNRLHIEGTVVARAPRQIEAPRKQLALPKPERAPAAEVAAVAVGKKGRAAGTGKGVLVRLQPAMLLWLDGHRERMGQTRPEAIRDILGGEMIKQVRSRL